MKSIPYCGIYLSETEKKRCTAGPFGFCPLGTDWILVNCCDLMLATGCWRRGIIVPVHTSSETRCYKRERNVFIKDSFKKKKNAVQLCTDKSFITNTAPFHKKIRIFYFDFMVMSRHNWKCCVFNTVSQQDK